MLLMALLYYPTGILAQQKIEFDSPIKEQLINNYTGTLLVKTRKALFGIDQETKQISWENNDLSKVDFSEYSEIPFTPIVIFTQKPFINSKALSRTLNSRGTSKIILNIVTGKILFDSQKLGFKAVNNTFMLPQKKAVLVDGIKDKELVVSLYSFESEKELWQSSGADSKFFKSLKGFFFDDEKVLLDAQQDIYWLKNKQLIKIDGETGEVVFEKDNITSIALTPHKHVLFVFSDHLGVEKLGQENAVVAINIKTQKELWEAPTMIWGDIKDTAFEQDKLVVITSKGFNSIEVTTGAKKWDRSEALPLIKKIVPHDSGYLVVQDNFLVGLNEEGKKRWEKKIRITHEAWENPIYLIDGGQEVLYITPSQANKVKIDDGSKLWEENVSLNSAGFLERNLKLSDSYFTVWKDTVNRLNPVYADNKFYIFNPKSSQTPTALEGFNFKRSAPSLKIRAKGYLIHLHNAFHFYDISGNLVYEKNYPEFENQNLLSGTVYWAKRGFGTYISAIGFVAGQISRTVNTVLVSTDLGPLGDVSSRIYGTYLSYRGSLDNLTALNKMGPDLHLGLILKRMQSDRKNEGKLLIVAPGENETEIIQLNIDSGKDKVLKTVRNSYSDFLVDQIERQIYFFQKKQITTVLFDD